MNRALAQRATAGEPHRSFAGRLIRSFRRGTLVGTVTDRARDAWSQWHGAATATRQRRELSAWMEHLRSRPPDVLIGGNFAESGGVRHHLLAIQRYSALRIELAPSDRLMRNGVGFEVTKTLKQPFMEFFPAGMRAVHSHVFPWFIVWCRAHQHAVRWVHTYHLNYFPEHAKNGLLPWQEEINHALLHDARHADIRLSVARWQQEALRRTHQIETIYLPNGVDVPGCDQANARRFRRQVGDGEFVLFVGRNDPVKNPAAFVQLAARLPRTRFVMLGHGLSPAILRDEWEVEVPPNLLVLGPAAHAEVQDALAACSALVVTSRREGLPTLVLEAMAQRRPIVLPDEAGCMEAIGGGEFGFIYRQDNLDDLADKTLLALADRTSRAGARQRVLEEYDWRVVAPALDALYSGKIPALFSQRSARHAIRTA